ncbi:GNAT family N-acetyltransferase [Salinispira pacifica]|uniref:GNAT family N-acetyltransferase n=1 Tax=Salinispira pacifica TaxID=1307761 RepID=UPI00040B978F|nr:GNAT family N-acetyltransferase [Salinispira pacifica]
MKYIYNYKDNQVLRRSFDDLCRRTFGISFERWYEKGLWGDSYVCHSIQDGDRIVANVSVTSMQLAGDHGLRTLTQIGTVMTDPEYRGKGLAAELMNRVIGQYENESEAFYLFANDTVLDFIPDSASAGWKEWQSSPGSDSTLQGTTGFESWIWTMMPIPHSLPGLWNSAARHPHDSSS